jgi:hypothetical protein
MREPNFTQPISRVTQNKLDLTIKGKVSKCNDVG